MFNRARNGSSIFRSEQSLSPSYMPAEVPGREEECQAIAAALRPVTHGKPPVNLLVHGPAGGGKTTTVDQVLDQLTEESRVTTARINCWQYDTRPSLLSQLLIELGFPATRKGTPIDELLSRLQEWLAKHHGAAIMLDEFDRHREQTAIIYDLQHLREQVENKLGTVLISNQPPAAIQLDTRSDSRLGYRPIYFPPYDREELMAVLHDRVDEAFQPEAVSEQALTTIADRVADDSGDCRQALELLHRAGRLADRENAETLTTEHVIQSVDAIEK